LGEEVPFADGEGFWGEGGSREHTHKVARLADVIVEGFSLQHEGVWEDVIGACGDGYGSG